MLQLNPPIPLMCRVNGTWQKGFAEILLDPGIEHDLQWVCFLDATGECWTLRNQDIRAQKNVTIGRTLAGVAMAPLKPEDYARVIDRASEAMK